MRFSTSSITSGILFFDKSLNKIKRNEGNRNNQKSGEKKPNKYSRSTMEGISAGNEVIRLLDKSLGREKFSSLNLNEKNSYKCLRLFELEIRLEIELTLFFEKSLKLKVRRFDKLT